MCAINLLVYRLFILFNFSHLCSFRKCIFPKARRSVWVFHLYSFFGLCQARNVLKIEVNDREYFIEGNMTHPPPFYFFLNLFFLSFLFIFYLCAFFSFYSIYLVGSFFTEYASFYSTHKQCPFACSAYFSIYWSC